MPLVHRPHRALLTLVPSHSDRRAAIRLTLSVGVPALALMLAGWPNLIIYAAFGAFTGMYGRDEPHQLRVIHQAQGAAMLVGGATIGIGLASFDVGPWELIASEAVLAALGSIIADRNRLKPVGPFFAIFALGACASVPPAVPWWWAVIICCCSAGFAMLVGFAGWVGDRSWQPGVTRAVSSTSSRGVGIHALRYLLAVGAAGSLGLLMGTGHPYWAMAAAAVPLAAETLRGRIGRGIHRVAGTLVGVGVTALILLPRPSVTALVFIVIALQFPTELFMIRYYGLALTFFTPMILIMTLLANPLNSASLIPDRALETFIGAAAGVAVALCIREPRLPRDS